MNELLYLTWELRETRAVSRQTSLRGGDLEEVKLDQEWIGYAIDQKGRTAMSASYKTEQEMREKLSAAFPDTLTRWEDPNNSTPEFQEILKRLK